MSTREALRRKILELVPFDRFVPAGDVVSTLSIFPSKAVWSQIVVLAMEGIITADRPGTYDGAAMIRRVA
jgi:hypothetical protein